MDRLLPTKSVREMSKVFHQAIKKFSAFTKFHHKVQAAAVLEWLEVTRGLFTSQLSRIPSVLTQKREDHKSGQIRIIRVT